MAKLRQYTPRIKDVELTDFITDVRNILNQGRYTPTIVTTVPTATGEEGQEVIYYSGTTFRRYTYVNGAWRSTSIGQAQEVSWGYITISGTPASQTKAVTFATAFTTTPLVLVSYIGVKTGTVPTGPGDFTSANTLRTMMGFAPTTSGFTAAVYTGNGSNLSTGEHEGFGYHAFAI